MREGWQAEPVSDQIIEQKDWISGFVFRETSKFQNLDMWLDSENYLSATFQNKIHET